IVASGAVVLLIDEIVHGLMNNIILYKYLIIYITFLIKEDKSVVVDEVGQPLDLLKKRYTELSDFSYIHVALTYYYCLLNEHLYAMIVLLDRLMLLA
ncbi:hypothetical protein ACJX0J_012752, partial [Zea mays]